MASLQDRRVWIGGGVAGAIVIAAAGWFLLVSPELSSASTLRDQAAATNASNLVLSTKVAELEKKNSELPSLTANLARAMDSLPASSALPTFTRQLTAQAAATHVSITSITVGSIAQVAPVVAPTTAPTDSTTSDSTAATSTDPTTTTDPAAVASGPMSVAVTVVADGSLAHQLAFLHSLQVVGPRGALVNSSQLAQGSDANVSSIDSSATLTAQLTVFVNPQTPQQIAQLNKLLSGDIGS